MAAQKLEWWAARPRVQFDVSIFDSTYKTRLSVADRRHRTTASSALLFLFIYHAIWQHSTYSVSECIHKKLL